MRFWIWMMVVVGCADDRGPRLLSAEPEAAPAGAQIVLHGERLCGDQANCQTAAGEIDIGDSPAVRLLVIDYQDTSATVMIPTGTTAGTSSIIVVVNERSSNALDFEVLPPQTP